MRAVGIISDWIWQSPSFPEPPAWFRFLLGAPPFLSTTTHGDALADIEVNIFAREAELTAMDAERSGVIAEVANRSPNCGGTGGGSLDAEFR